VDERILGANIRDLRHRSGLTLTALAGKSAMTKSTLSKIETGRVSSSIATLVRVAAALNVSVAEFFAEPSENPAWVLTRKGEGRIITRDGSRFGYSYEALALGMKGKIGEPFVLTIEPGDPEGSFQHGGQEFIYVLSGRVELSIGGEPLRLAPGDSLYFDPSRVHTTRVLGKHPVKFLAVFLQETPHSSRREVQR